MRRSYRGDLLDARGDAGVHAVRDERKAHEAEPVQPPPVWKRTFVIFHAIEQIATMAWGRPKFDSHTDLHSASVFHGAVRPPSGRLPS